MLADVKVNEADEECVCDNRDSRKRDYGEHVIAKICVLRFSMICNNRFTSPKNVIHLALQLWQ